MTQKTKDNVFMDADRMLHQVASTDYKDTELYHTKNMREWFYKDWYFRDCILVGKVDRENERVLIKLPYKEYVGGQTAMYYCTRALTEAFRHYTPITLTAFDMDEAEMLFTKALLDVQKRKTYKRMKYFLVAAKTYEYLGGNTNDNGDFVTTRGVLVQDQRGLVKKLLKKFVACKTDKAREKFIGLHVGSFEIREWDTEGQFLQVGCHRFPLKALEQLASEL